MNTTTTLPSAFIWRRLHSLTGLWFTLFLIEHLFVNSQAALMLGDNGRGFVELVKAIHNLPYLQVIEITLLGIPILVHMIWGVKYLFTAKFNSFKTAPNKPSLPEYGRNKAYTWQRITSWILLVALTFHVVKFRFVDYPLSAPLGASTSYFVRLSVDDGLYTVADRLKVTLYDGYEVEKEKEKLQERSSEQTIVDAARILHQESNPFTQAMHPKPYDAQKAIILSSAQNYEERVKWVKTLGKLSLDREEVVAVASDFGTASLLSVRETFKNPIYVFFYTIFVLAACFHAFNGFWTFLITWGVILKMSAQKAMTNVAIAIMVLVTFLGLISIWGTYWLNLRH